MPGCLVEIRDPGQIEVFHRTDSYVVILENTFIRFFKYIKPL